MDLKEWIENKIRENSWEHRLEEDSPYEDNAGLIAKLSKVPKKKVKLKNGKTVQVRDYLPEIDEKKQEILNRTGQSQHELSYPETGQYSDYSYDEEGANWRQNNRNNNMGSNYRDVFGDYKTTVYTPKEHNAEFKYYLDEAVDEGFMDKSEARDLYADREYQGEKLKQANKDTKDYQKLINGLTEENAIVSPYKLEDEISNFTSDARWKAIVERAAKYRDYLKNKYNLPENESLDYYIRDFIDDGKQTMWNAYTEEIEKALGKNKDKFIQEAQQIAQNNPIVIPKYNEPIYTAYDLANDIDNLEKYSYKDYSNYNDGLGELNPTDYWYSEAISVDKLPRKNSRDYNSKSWKLSKEKHDALDKYLNKSPKNYRLTYDDYLDIMNNLDVEDNLGAATRYYLDSWKDYNTKEINSNKKLKKKQKLDLLQQLDDAYNNMPANLSKEDQAKYLNGYIKSIRKQIDLLRDF